MITQRAPYIRPEPVKITVTLADPENQKIMLWVGEIISGELHPENVFLTVVRCTLKRNYVIVESIGEVTMQLEIQLTAYH